MMVVHALANADSKNKKIMMKIIGNTKATQNDVLQVIDIFREIGSIEYAQNKLEEYRKNARDCLEVLKESESKEVLAGLADYSVTREY